MRRPRLLDLFCCEGGAGVGYMRAGFEVVGVDIVPQDRYPLMFVQADALEYLREHGHEFDAVHASPPCQAYSTITPNPEKHPELIAPVRAILLELGVPYIIENVEGARAELHNPIRLCGSTFGLKVRRHRYFESNAPLLALDCRHDLQGTPVGVYGGLRTKHWERPTGTSRGRKALSVEEAAEAMGISWMDWDGLREAIPPAFTEFLGSQLLDWMEHDDRSGRRLVGKAQDSREA